MLKVMDDEVDLFLELLSDILAVVLTDIVLVSIAVIVLLAHGD